MKKINRRAFIGKGALGIGGALALSQIPQQLFSNSLFNLQIFRWDFKRFPSGTVSQKISRER